MTARKGKKLLLDIGSGARPKRGHVGVDKFVDRAGIIPAYAWELPFDDASVDGIYTSHLIEHLKPRELDLALREWYRVLKKGALLTIRCPNFPLYVREFLERGEEWRDEWGLRNIFGWRNKPGQCHFNGFWVERFQRLLPAYGFTVISCAVVATRARKGVEYRPDGDVLCQAVKR